MVTNNESFLPVVKDGKLFNQIDTYLAKGLDEDGLLRLGAVEKTIQFFSTRNGTLKEFTETYNKIYNFLKDGRQEELRA
jgi:hypothetical protein